MCRAYLAAPGAVRDMAALVVGRLLTSPDTGPALRELVIWAADTLTVCPEDQAHFLVPGECSGFKAIKLGHSVTCCGACEIQGTLCKERLTCFGSIDSGHALRLFGRRDTIPSTSR